MYRGTISFQFTKNLRHEAASHQHHPPQRHALRGTTRAGAGMPHAVRFLERAATGVFRSFQTLQTPHRLIIITFEGIAFYYCWIALSHSRWKQTNVKNKYGVKNERERTPRGSTPPSLAARPTTHARAHTQPPPFLPSRPSVSPLPKPKITPSLPPLLYLPYDSSSEPPLLSSEK